MKNLLTNDIFNFDVFVEFSFNDPHEIDIPYGNNDSKPVHKTILEKKQVRLIFQLDIIGFWIFVINNYLRENDWAMTVRSDRFSLCDCINKYFIQPITLLVRILLTLLLLK